jgi:hypothetical protein
MSSPSAPPSWARDAARVGIGVAIPEAVVLFNQAQATDDLAPGEPEILQHFTGVVGQSAAVADTSGRVTAWVGQISCRVKPGSTSTISLFHTNVPSPTTAETTVAAISLETDARWKTISALAASKPRSWAANPSRNAVASPAMAARACPARRSDRGFPARGWDDDQRRA